jgi:hypothetical protein|tara:strand:+ start:367 stop:750 length:384 start_codon:yes stop_codon:yes gene_type:complete
LEIPTDKGAEMPKQALIVNSDLTTKVIDIEGDELGQLQRAVEGLIQPVELTDIITMWVNEEGLFQGGLSLNQLASAFMQEIGSETPIMGNAVFTGGTDEDGNTLGMAEDVLAELLEIADGARQLVFG